jgi:Family of unknown function (DUF6533)
MHGMQCLQVTTVSGTALLAYDTLLTLTHEVKYLWLKNFKLGTALYILARHFTLLGLFVDVLSQLWNTSLQVGCFGP